MVPCVSCSSSTKLLLISNCFVEGPFHLHIFTSLSISIGQNGFKDYNTECIDSIDQYGDSYVNTVGSTSPYTHTHTHTYIYIYIYVYLLLFGPLIFLSNVLQYSVFRFSTYFVKLKYVIVFNIMINSIAE